MPEISVSYFRKNTTHKAINGRSSEWNLDDKQVYNAKLNPEFEISYVYLLKPESFKVQRLFTCCS